MHRQPAALIAQPVYRGFCRILRRIERNADGELAAHAGLGIHGDIAVHHADELLTNRQPQSGALEVTLHAGTDLEERIEQANHLLRRDANPRVAHANAQVIPCPADVQHNTAGIGKFDGVAEQVRDDLLQAHRIAVQRQRHVRFDKAVEPQLFTHHQRQIVGADVVHHLAR